MVTSNLLSSLDAVFFMTSTTEQSIEEGSQRYLKRTKNLVKKKQEAKTQHGKFLYKNYISKFSDELTRVSKVKARGRASAFAADWKAILGLRMPVVAHLTLRTILDSLSSETPRNRLAVQIGNKLDDEIRLSHLKKRHPKWWGRLETRKKARSSYHFKRALSLKLAKKDFGDDWADNLCPWMTPTTKCHLGLTLIELFRTLTGLVEYTKRRKNAKRWEIIVLPSPLAIAWLAKFKSKVAKLLPYHLPYTSEPPDWVSLTEGGYEYPDEIGWSFIKTQTKTAPKNNNIKTTLKAANVLQRVPYRVNPWVLQVITEGISRGFSFDGHCNYSSEVDLSSRPSGLLEETHCTLEYRLCQAKKHREKRRLMPQYIQTSTVLTLANKYIDNTLFFPVQADFRGRLYYVPKCLNPQGSPLAKGLLQFANPTPTKGAEDWFLIGGANVFGIKGSLKDRQEWVVSNEESIRRVANDPFGMASFWLEASEPFLFLAFCHEFADWVHNRLNFQTRLPVRLDHTASGLQMVALITGDKELQKLTNLIDPSQPYDVYQEILSKMYNILSKSPRPEDHRWKLDRALVKSLTVTYMYGGTDFGLERAVVTWYHQAMNDDFGTEIYSEIRLLILLFKDALSAVSPSPAKFMQETRKEQGDEVLSWNSPSGFQVINQYFPQASVAVKTSVNGERIRGRVNVKNTAKLCTRSARQALPANRIHAYDAALLHLILAGNEWPDILTLHDCYGVPPTDCERLIKNISSTLGQIFELDMHPTLWYAAS